MLRVLGCIYVVGLFWLVVPLRFQHVHLLVLLSQLWVLHRSQLLLDRRLLVVLLLEHHGFALQCLLEFGWLRVKSVIVEPLLLEVSQFPDAEADCAGERGCLKHADFIVKCDLLLVVGQADLPDLEGHGKGKECELLGAVCLICFVLQVVLVFDCVVRSVVVAKKVGFFDQICHDSTLRCEIIN